MKDREQFERQQSYHKEDFKPFCAGLKSGAESKQAELDKVNKEVEYYLSAYRLAHKQAMDNGQARDKANARIAQLVDALQQLYDYQNGCPLPIYGTDRTNAMTKANLALTNSSDTWLSQHDKAVEVEVLEGLIKKLTYEWDGDYDTKGWHEADQATSEMIGHMIDSRK